MASKAIEELRAAATSREEIGGDDVDWYWQNDESVVALPIAECIVGELEAQLERPSHFHEQVMEAIKGIRQRQESGISFINDDLVNLLRELDNALGTEQAMHAAWRKRAEEAEGRIANALA